MNDRRDLLQESLATIKRLQARLATSEAGAREPIAIIGAACRYPGDVENIEDLWRVVRDGVNAVTEVPADRWDVNAYYDPDPAAPNKMVTRRAGFVGQVDRFDPQFFGISPREAQTMDPQQRLLLETAYESLESAGLAVEQLAGSATGVFVGITTSDYARLLQAGGPDSSDVYSATGVALNAAAGRISFTFGFQGPCVALDTACSSSLVATHLACQSLRTGESDLVLAGGVNLILSPDAMVLFSKWGMMAPDGACKTFDAAADGFVRAEGCAVIALKRLSDALAAGDPILAVIRASAVNSDGRSSGLTVPNGPAQEAVLRRALANAGLKAADIDYVEAHGTGTPLGDPIEVEALGAVLGTGRPAGSPLRIGSVKTNLGHTEAASGLAGLLKTALALRHETLPPSLHFSTPNPRIDWEHLPIEVQAGLTAWPRRERPRRAGVSSFGFSGTNAHVILEEAPLRGQAPEARPGAVLLPLSARNEQALRDLAGRFALATETPGVDLHALAAAAGTGRSHMTRRAAVTGESAGELAATLHALAAGDTPADAALSSIRVGERPKVAFLFTGQGAQYAGMGRTLYDREPVFRAVIDRAQVVLADRLERPLTEVLFGQDDGIVSQTAYTQPALFALEYALAEQWRAWGVTPAIVMGHSVGEYVAACVAGVFDFENGLDLIAARGRAMQDLPEGGAMAAVFATADRVAAEVARCPDRASVAALNGPEETVIAGAAEAVASVLAAMAAQGVESRRLDVSHAFHSPLLEPMLAAFEARAAGLTYASPKIPLISNLTGRVFGPGEAPDATYWRRHAREPVRFVQGLDALRQAGVSALVEIGPHPTLIALAGRAAPDAVWSALPSLRRGRDDQRQMLQALGGLYVRGQPVNWHAFAEAEPRRRAVLPTYPFQRTRHWIEGSASPTTTSFSGEPSSHAMLGVKAAVPVDIYQTRLGDAVQSWTKDHRIFGFMPFPAAGFLELALAAARECDGPEAALENVTIAEGLLLPETGAVEAQVVLGRDANGRRSVQVYSAAPAVKDVRWRLHMSAMIDTRGQPQSSSLPADTQGFRAISAEAYYERISGLGAEFGPSFRGVQTMRRNGREMFAEVALPYGLAAGYVLHPALLDACFHPLGICMEAEEAEGTSTDLFMPVGARRFAVYRDGATAGLARVTGLTGGTGADSVVADVALFDEGGALIAEVIGLEVRRATRTALERMMQRSSPQADWRFGIDWRVSASEDALRDLAGQNWLVFADSSGVAEAFATRMRAAGASVELIAPPAVVDEKHIASLVAKAAPISRPLHGAALLWALDAPASFDDNDALDAAACTANASALFALRAVADRAARLLVVTRCTQQIDMETGADLVQSSIWAFAGVVAAEYPTCGLTRVDLSVSAFKDEDAEALCAEAAATDMEDRVAYRSGQRHVARLSLAEARAEQAPVALDIRERGSLEQLIFAPLDRRAPGPGEIELRVLATGLNFRDVLNVLGAYPGDPGPLGNECAGVVTAVGPSVTRFAVGDDVVAMVDRSFATYCIAPEAMCVRKPAHLTHQEAATVPVAFLTADHALHALAKIKAGDRVLVHAVTGGVGMAAAQIALSAGAIVYGTVGTAAKRALARKLGVHFTSDSRSLAFVDDILRDSNGEGVDIVLNSLAGEFIPASLGLVRQGGSFIEIGKTDIWDAGKVAAEYPGIRYHALYLGDVAAADPAMMRERLDRILSDMGEAGTLKPLPQTVFRFEEAERAFRYVAQGLHTGKVVLTQRLGAEIRRDGTYVLTGGLTGVGLATARWLAEQGAGGILLIGRRAPSEEAQPVIAEMEALGARVLTAQADVGDTATLSLVLEDARQKMGPIRGVIHAAGVLDDGMLSEQTPERFARAMAPKVRGGWALHRLTLRDPLDFFILFSSGAALLGSAGQSNYAAANGFLDGLAHYRRARGLSALSINWGSWSDVGMAAGVSADHHRRWSAMGLEMITRTSGMEMLGEMIRSGAGPQVVAVPLVRTRLPTNVSPFYQELVNRQDAKVDTAPPINIMNDLLAAEPSERQALLDNFLADQVQRTLALPQAVDRHESLLNLSMDSLMAMELRNRLLSALGVQVAVADLLGGATVTDIGRMLMRHLVIEEAKQAPVTADTTWEEGRL